MGRKAKVWEVRDDIRPMMIKLKKRFPTTIGHVRTKRILVVGFQNRSSGHVARIRANKMPWAITLPNYDYALEVWATRFDNLPKSQKWYVLLHELMHIPQGGHEEGNRLDYRKLINHDIEDFSSLLNHYGIYMENTRDIFKGERGLVQKQKKADKDVVPKGRVVKLG